ncbi:hypothetical protein BDK51DRAFT_32404 [Blyttiomyces helicus]|uniref:Uncharacterized protein n=1 Tax=Blyttiomyces helicus TaxID=388810 RepID=A0A4P9W5N1_9FUNG|nr:hypothetical protein BDK51DRAFT_32404 [Blyttiomyces helicus]|eukprot:RKO85406.1 hypothetical protein BDK51DRAFT_32404 [Blyttiomyces helicus]
MPSSPRNLKSMGGNLQTDMNRHTQYAVDLAWPDHHLERLNLKKSKPAMRRDCKDNERSDVLSHSDIDTENSCSLSCAQGSRAPALSPTDPLHHTPGSPVAPTSVAASTFRRMLAPVQSIANCIIEDAYHPGTALVAKRVIDLAGKDSSDDGTTSSPTTVSKPARKKRTLDTIPLPDAQPIHDRLDKKPVPTRVEYALRAQAHLADSEFRKDDAAMRREEMAMRKAEAGMKHDLQKMYAEAVRRWYERGCEGPLPLPPAF